MLVSNIQRMCFHDGPGIRTTVFLKGCNLKCPWCANPENINFGKEEYIDSDGKGIYGYDISIEELKNEILKDKSYYENGGGVTFSGGEPLLHIKEIELLLKKLKDENINICIETALMIPEEYIQIALQYVDQYIIDIKILSINECKNVLNGNVELYKKNVKTIFNNNKKVIFRIPLIRAYTYNEENLRNIYMFLEEYKPEKVEIFKVHALAKKKYNTLNRKMIDIKQDITDTEIDKIKQKIIQIGIDTEIIHL